MRRLVVADPGTESLRTYAVGRALLLGDRARELGVDSMRKYFTALGFTVFARGFADGGYFVRITGGIVDDGRLLLPTTPAPNPYSAYVVKGGQLKEYATTSAALSSSDAPRLSFNGQTYVSRSDAPSASAYISRRHRAAQAVTPILDTGGSKIANAFDYLPDNLPSGNIGNALMHQSGSRTHYAWTSQDGQWVTVLEPRHYPHIMRISAAQLAQESLDPSLWTGGTSFDVVSSGEPPPLAAYKAEKAGHIYRYYGTAGSASDANVSAAWLQTHFETGEPYYVRLPEGTGSAAPGKQLVDYDYLNDRLLLCITVPYVSSSSRTTVPTFYSDVTAFIGYEQVLWQYDYASATWTEVGRRTNPDVAYSTWRENAGGGSGAFGALTSVLETYNGATVRTWSSAESFNRVDNDSQFPHRYCDFVLGPSAKPKRFWIASPVIRTGGVLSLTGDTAKVFVDGVQQPYTLPPPAAAADIMQTVAWAPGGFLYKNDIVVGAGYHWFDVASNVDVAVALDANTGQQPWLSPDGRHVWTDVGNLNSVTLPSPRYYSKGALKRTWAPVPTTSLPLPDASAASFAAYASPSPDGFWFVNDFLGWSTKIPGAAKLSVFVSVSGSSSTPIPVLSGTCYCAGSPIITYVVDDTRGGIAPDLSGIWLLNVDHFQFFDNATLAATFGSPVTYSTGAGYNITNPASYTWNMATLLLQYDEAKDVFKTLHTYGGSVATTEDPGNPATPAVTLTGQILVQDELIPHK